MVEIRGVETGGFSGRNQENLVPHVQRGEGMEACYFNRCRELQVSDKCLRYAHWTSIN
jgi:predicted metal-binding protein